MLALQARIQGARRHHTRLVNSPKGDHHANGRAEKGVQVFQNLARRMKLALEGRLGLKIPHKHPILFWLIEWVGGAHNRFRQGLDDGKTPRERVGWSSQSVVAEFGETVDFIPFEAGSKAKFDSKLLTGVWLGLDNRSDEHLIGTPAGVLRASTIKARVEEDRWNADTVFAVRGLPWNPTPGATDDAGARMPNPSAADAEVVPRDAEVGDHLTRRLYILREDVKRFDPTPGCLGCRCAMSGRPPQNHTPTCRERMEKMEGGAEEDRTSRGAHGRGHHQRVREDPEGAVEGEAVVGTCS